MTANFVIALLERLLSQPFPTFESVHAFGGLHRHIQITAFNSQVKPSLVVLDEMQGNLE
jgi:hypothetical protein